MPAIQHKSVRSIAQVETRGWLRPTVPVNAIARPHPCRTRLLLGVLHRHLRERRAAGSGWRGRARRRPVPTPTPVARALAGPARRGSRSSLTKIVPALGLTVGCREPSRHLNGALRLTHCPRPHLAARPARHPRRTTARKGAPDQPAASTARSLALATDSVSSACSTPRPTSAQMTDVAVSNEDISRLRCSLCFFPGPQCSPFGMSPEIERDEARPRTMIANTVLVRVSLSSRPPHHGGG
jgi:hypothetical protein